MPRVVSIPRRPGAPSPPTPLFLWTTGRWLPATLIENDALDVEKRAARVSRLHGVLRRVADDARAAILRPPSHETRRLRDDALFDDELHARQQARDYYTQPAPAGAPYGGMPCSTRSWTTPALPTQGVEGPRRRTAGRSTDGGVRAAERRLRLRVRRSVKYLRKTTCFCLRETAVASSLFYAIRPPG